ncbi:izumo sperm-egg fusion protein 1 isoform X3 [Ornithorhynchus anatinus]|uniref:izumo sperm-egg fusion protein 1 isoform X3 n=1 Tax=Ornithorhynchus anatinus TaxID=9258 RepID=UPI0010A7F94E|nr:izumo sperm-egg fusion protein 1 isoform X3 [Ornithorhynchus anatinus]
MSRARLLSLSLSLLSWAPAPGLGCLWCDAGVEAEMRVLKKEYLPNHLQGLPDMRKKLGSRLEDAIRDLSKLPFSEDTYMGYIDEHTLNTASWGFLNELKRITESEVKDGQLVNQLLWLMQEQKSAFIRLISQFQKEAFCPNKCGRMLQTLIWCQKCKKQKYLCEKPPFCGERLIEIQEDEELILDCGLTWHSVSHGLTDYSFYRCLLGLPAGVPEQGAEACGAQEDLDASVPPQEMKTKMPAGEVGPTLNPQIKCKLIGAAPVPVPPLPAPWPHFP